MGRIPEGVDADAESAIATHAGAKPADRRRRQYRDDLDGSRRTRARQPTLRGLRRSQRLRTIAQSVSSVC